jgi:hypothetical protein
LINVFVSLAAVMAILVGQAATPTRATYYFNVFDGRAIRYQNPDQTACTSTSTIVMLNTMFYASAATGAASTRGSASAATFVWKPTVSYNMQKSILRWERGHMTMLLSTPGSDVHGWRNALNYFGWGSITAGVYADYSYKTFTEAALAAVRALAMTS